MRNRQPSIASEEDLPAIPAVEEAELDIAHIISTSYPRRGKALKETPDARITTRSEEPA